MNEPLTTDHGRISFGGTHFAYESIGSGRTVVVLHGGPGLGNAYLRPALDRLADEFRVVYWDQRGSGATPVGDETRMNLRGAVDDLRAFLDGLGIERANLLGHSYGADLAALFAAHQPDRVGSLVLANPGPPFDLESMEALSAEMQRRRTADDRAALERIASSHELARREPAAAEDYIRHVYLPFFNDRAVGMSIRYSFSEHSAATVVEGEEAFFGDFEYTRDALAALDQVNAPTLVLYAERDPIPESFARRLAERIPGARYVRLAGAGHFGYIEDADDFFGTVTPFLRQHAV
jgi:proline iminopeptidase